VFPLPVAASTTVAPLIGLPSASCTVTVIVELPVPAMNEVGEAATVDNAAEGDPTVTVTLAVCVTSVPSIVADTVFVSGTIELKVPIATPLALVGLAGCVNEFPVPVADSTTVAPLIGLPLASLAVTEIVVLPLGAVMEVGEAATLDCALDTGPGLTETYAFWVMGTPSAVADTAFVPALVELNVPSATPSAWVDPCGCVNVFPAPVAASTTVAPLIGLPLPSRTVTVIVELPLPAMNEVGEAATVDNAADGDPTETVTLAVCVIAVPSIVADTVLVSATVELKLPVATPLALVGLLG